jgi:hypothetical protein
MGAKCELNQCNVEQLEKVYSKMNSPRCEFNGNDVVTLSFIEVSQDLLI